MFRSSCSIAMAALLVACGTTNAPDGGVAVDGGFDAGMNQDAGTIPADAGLVDAGPGRTLQWYMTCGDPVCSAPMDAGPEDAGTCPALGTSCSTQGEICGTPSSANCGVVEECDDHDPRSGGCPLSSRQFKDGIEYLDAMELTRLHDETLRLKLATYNYKPLVSDENSRHLGFIIEDDPLSYAVNHRHNRVDVYGYLSMVVATMQVQEERDRSTPK